MHRWTFHGWTLSVFDIGKLGQFGSVILPCNWCCDWTDGMHNIIHIKNWQPRNKCANAQFRYSHCFVICLVSFTISNSSGFWSGQRILLYYAFLELLALAVVLYLIYYAQSTLVAFNDNYHALEAGETDVSFAPFEFTVSDKFNSFFFGASNGCRGIYVLSSFVLFPDFVLSAIRVVLADSGQLLSLPDALLVVSGVQFLQHHHVLC